MERARKRELRADLNLHDDHVTALLRRQKENTRHPLSSVVDARNGTPPPAVPLDILVDARTPNTVFSITQSLKVAVSLCPARYRVSKPPSRPVVLVPFHIAYSV